MKILFKMLIIALLLTSKLYSAEPVIYVPPLPPNNQLELYEDSEGLFTMIVMEYYQMAVALESQLYMMDVKPSEKVYPPSFEDLEDLDIKTIKKFHSMAWALQEQLIQTPEPTILGFKRALLDTIEYLNNRNWDTKNDCIEERIKLSNKKDSVCNMKLESLEAQYNNFPKNSVTVLSVAVTENLFISNGNGVVESNPSLGVRLNLNGYKILGFWKGLDFWYEYMAPRFTTIYTFSVVGESETIVGQKFSEEWNSNMSAIGISSNIHPLFGTENYSDGFRFGVGYFWSNGKVYNRRDAFFNWSGLKLDLNYYAGLPDRRFPIEILFGFTLFHSFNDDLVFHTANNFSEPLNVGNTHISLNLGLKYNFWRSPY